MDSSFQLEVLLRMDLDINFNGKMMCTPVYIKMDSQEALLLSKGVSWYGSGVVVRGEQSHSRQCLPNREQMCSSDSH